MVQNQEAKRPRLFISHRFDDKDAAKVVADRLEKISDQIKIYLASNPKFEGPRAGKSVNRQLAEALGTTSIVLLLFTVPDEDWSWCMWECGVATDPKDAVPTNVVTIQLSGKAPKVYSETLMVAADDQDSVLAFVNQLCTDAKFFPDLGAALTTRKQNDPFVREQAQALFEELAPYTATADVVEETRWGGFRISVAANHLKPVKESKEAVSGQGLDALLKSASISNLKGAGLEHFGYTALEDDMTLSTLRKRWEAERGEVLVENRPWTEILAEEIWRIVTKRKTNLTWEPFHSLKEYGLWAYPIIYQYRTHISGRYDFEVLMIQTPAPTEGKVTL